MAVKMNIDRLICPRGAGVASAIGMLASAISFEIARAAPSGLEALDFARAAALIGEMDGEASALATGAGVDAATVTRRLSVMMRYVGQGYEIETPLAPETVAAGDREGVRAAFTEAYRRRYGRSESLPVELLSWRLAVEGPRSSLRDTLLASAAERTAEAEPLRRRPAWFGDGFLDTPVHRRAGLRRGAAFSGPAIIEEDESTTILPPGFSLTVDRALNLILTRDRPA